MKDEILKHLYNVREAAGAIIRFIENKTFDDYEQDELLRSGDEFINSSQYILRVVFHCLVKMSGTRQGFSTSL